MSNVVGVIAHNLGRDAEGHLQHGSARSAAPLRSSLITAGSIFSIFATSSGDRGIVAGKFGINPNEAFAVL
jgi:hypothetical protein